MRDIDRIMELVKSAIPTVQCEQLKVSHPADDDGLWFFRVAGNPGEVQAESSSGMCPFLIETNNQVAQGRTVEETADTIIDRLRWPKGR